MFSQGGLSLEQAPPISVVLRFFVTGAIFGIVLSIFMFLDLLHVDLGNIQPIVTHTLFLGVMASFMLGALFQMLPVIAGVIIKMPTKRAMIVHLLFVVGLLLQLSSFIYSSIPLLYFLGGAYLGIGLLYGVYLMLKELIKIKDHSSSSKGMIYSLVSFVIAIILGIYLLLSLGGYTDGLGFLKIRELHYSFALFGWLSLLIISVSFQVIEMFYVTPKYPNIMSRYLTLTIFILLYSKLVISLFGLELSIINILLSTLFILYAITTIHRLYHRKRPTSDATVWFWRLGMGLLIVTMLITISNQLIDIDHKIEMLSYITFIGFSLSIIFAMVYKIVPFLTWFHLSNQGYIEAPMMHDVIHPKKAKIHFYIHIIMLTILIISIFFNSIILNILSSTLVFISFGWLLYNLIYAIKKYDYTQKHTKKFEW